MDASIPSADGPITRVLGVIGIAGGAGLLAAFVLDIPPAWNTVRLVLFLAGAMAVALAVHGRHAALASRLAIAATVPLVAANAWSMGWILLSIGRERPFAGEFGLVGFYAGLAVWLADAWFGLVAFRIGSLWRPVTLALAIGSLLAITGMDRLELTTGASPTIFLPLSLIGIAVNGLAWMLLGIEVAWRAGGRRVRSARPGLEGGDVAGRPSET